MTKFGFLGMGNMGKSFLKGMIKFAHISKDNIYAYAPNQDKLHKNAKELGFMPCKDYDELLKNSDTIILCCKPYQIHDILEGLRGKIEDKTFISLISGWDLKKYSEFGIKVQYILPNLPVEVGEGVILMEDKYSISYDDRAELYDMLSKFSSVIELKSELIDAGSAISGCAPAFLDMFIEALSDGACKNGIPRKVSYDIIGKMVLGTSKMFIESGKHPGELKDMVCSPGGTTIKGVYALEKGMMRASLIEAVDKVCGK